MSHYNEQTGYTYGEKTIIQGERRSGVSIYLVQHLLHNLPTLEERQIKRVFFITFSTRLARLAYDRFLCIASQMGLDDDILRQQETLSTFRHAFYKKNMNYPIHIHFLNRPIFDSIEAAKITTHDLVYLDNAEFCYPNKTAPWAHACAWYVLGVNTLHTLHDLMRAGCHILHPAENTAFIKTQLEQLDSAGILQNAISEV